MSSVMDASLARLIRYVPTQSTPARGRPLETTTTSDSDQVVRRDHLIPPQTLPLGTSAHTE
jgi:hypothetical protein